LLKFGVNNEKAHSISFDNLSANNIFRYNYRLRKIRKTKARRCCKSIFISSTTPRSKHELLKMLLFRLLDPLFLILNMFAVFMWGLYLLNPFFAFVPFHVYTAPVSLTFWLVVYALGKRYLQRRKFLK